MSLLRTFSFASLFILLAQVGLAKNAKEEVRRYLVPEKIVKMAKSTMNFSKKVSQDGYHLVTMNEKQAVQLAEVIHHKSFTCGGFIDVENELSEGKALKSLIKGLNTKSVNKENFNVLEPQYPQQVQKTLALNQKDRFVGTLTTMSDFPDRYSRADTGRQAAMWILEEMRKFAQAHQRTDLSYEVVETGGRYVQPSVYAKIPGKDSSLPAIVIGGHMDTFRSQPGADDDASGVSTVIEIFRSTIASKLQFKRDIYFMAYAAEEMGLVGSGVVARNFKNAKTQVRAVMQLDMTGYASSQDTKKLFFVMDHVNAGLSAFTQKLAVRYLKIAKSDIGEIKCGYACSDHASWHRNGYASTFPFEASMNNYNRQIHTSQDTTNRLDMEHAMKFVRLGTAFVVELAEPQ